MLGEKENLTPGLSGDFTLNLDAARTRSTAPAPTPTSPRSRSPAPPGRPGRTTRSWSPPPSSTATWIDGEVKQLVTTTDAFTAAVKAGRLDEAKTLYGKARVHYERIEPTAEIWGDLDGRIDGRADDAATPADFTGFHRIEQAHLAAEVADRHGASSPTSSTPTSRASTPRCRPSSTSPR